MTTPTDEFVHLHVHSHNSLLDGYGTDQETIAEAAARIAPAVAIVYSPKWGPSMPCDPSLVELSWPKIFSYLFFALI